MCWYQISHQAVSDQAVLVYHHDSSRYRIECHQGPFDLAEFDSESTDFDLEVGAAQIVQLSRTVPPDLVSGTVQPRACRPERIRHEPLGSKVEASAVSAADSHTSHVKLTDHSGRDQLQARIQHVEFDIRNWNPNGDSVDVSRCRLLEGHYVGGLSGAVTVDDAHTGGHQIFEPTNLNRLTTEEHDVERFEDAVHVGIDQCIKCTRRHVRDLDVVVGDGAKDLGGVEPRCGDVNTATAGKRSPHILLREIETR